MAEFASSEALMDAAQGRTELQHTLCVRQSTLGRDAGDGLFLCGRAAAGDALALFPGVVYSVSELQLANALGLVDPCNAYVAAVPLLGASSSSTLFVDANVRDEDGPSARALKACRARDCAKAHVRPRPNPYALAHVANHAAAGRANCGFAPTRFRGDVVDVVPCAAFGAGGPAEGVGLALVALRGICDGEELFVNYSFRPKPGTPAWAAPAPKTAQQHISEERSCAEALMMACDERLGAQSPAALMVCDTFLARDLWTSFVHQSYLPPAASQVWVCGRNLYGQLGIGDTENRETPTEVTALHGRRIHAVACGLSHTMAVVDDGELWATGGNSSGQLGLGDTQNRSSFTRVSALSGRKMAAVACGGFHTLALLESGELFAWGWNNHGQLGLGTDKNRASAQPVAAFSGRRVVAIACGGWIHSVAVLETGELFAWGGNNHGQLGLGDNAKRNEPTQVKALAGRRVVAVACGEHQTSAVLESGELFTWGFNNFSQLGHGDRTESKNTPQLVEALRGRPVVAVACGESHTLALLKTGKVFAWGWNGEGQLGIGEFSRDPISTPQQVHFFDGSKRVMSIHCRGNFSGAVLESGELFLWGNNFSGQLGTGDRENRETPTLVTKLAGKRVLSFALGSNHTIALIK